MRLEGIAVTVMPWAFSDEKQGPGNQRIRPNPPSSAARRAGRTGGRPPKLTDDDIEAAKAMLANSDIGVTQIAHRLGVSPATLYRYMPAARSANTPDV
jgi:hypothetical protein